ncbi:MAG: hypothetical protein JNJ99_04200 [Crocinitomicaceae bacterium]|nr:hypothetical protein [Crocinitomicaceae bacterium]
MKKILGLAVLVMFSMITMAHSGVAFTNSTEGYNKASTQTFNFAFSTPHTIENIKAAAAYYTSYFTTTVAQEGDKIAVKITLVEDTEMSRRVISRFFTTLEVKSIEVNGLDVVLNEFMDTYVLN